jgi:hypothetical protein
LHEGQRHPFKARRTQQNLIDLQRRRLQRRHLINRKGNPT